MHTDFVQLCQCVMYYDPSHCSKNPCDQVAKALHRVVDEYGKRKDVIRQPQMTTATAAVALHNRHIEHLPNNELAPDSQPYDARCESISQIHDAFDSRGFHIGSQFSFGVGSPLFLDEDRNGPFSQSVALVQTQSQGQQRTTTNQSSGSTQSQQMNYDLTLLLRYRPTLTNNATL